MGIRGLWSFLRAKCPQVLLSPFVSGVPVLAGHVCYVDAMLVVTRCAHSISSTEPGELVHALLDWDARVRARHRPSEMVYVFDGARLPEKSAWEGRRRDVEFERQRAALERAREERDVELCMLAAEVEAGAEAEATWIDVAGAGAGAGQGAGLKGAANDSGIRFIDDEPVFDVDGIVRGPGAPKRGMATRAGADGGQRPALVISPDGSRLRLLQATSRPPAAAEHGIHATDGGMDGETRDRLARRTTAAQRLERLEYDIHVKEARQNIHVTRSVAEKVAQGLAEALRDLGEPFNVLRAEADAEMACVALSFRTARSTVITDDGDAVALGSTSTLIHATQDDREAVVDVRRVAKALGVEAGAEWRAVCVLAGCDYGPHVANLGFATALAEVKKFRDVHGRAVDPASPLDWQVLLSTCRRAGPDRTWLASLALEPSGECCTCGKQVSSRLRLWEAGSGSCPACTRATFLETCAPSLLAEAGRVLAMREEPYMAVVEA